MLISVVIGYADRPRLRPVRALFQAERQRCG